MLRSLCATIAALVVALWPVAVRADMPWPRPGPGQDPYAYQDYLRTSTVPPPANDYDPHDWKLSSTVDPSVPPTAQELGGVVGPSVDKAWTVSTGRPDVRIAVLDSGIMWNDAAAMRDLRDKVYLNWAELPPPEYTDAHGVVHTACAGVNLPPRRAGTPFPRCYDVDGDGVFNLEDYASDPRVNPPQHRYFCCGQGQPAMLTPEDLIEVFTCYDASTGSIGVLTSGATGPLRCSNQAQSIDNDHDGFAHDIAGWNFMERTNDPYDEPNYGHGSGEAEDSNAEANNGGHIGTCPSCMVMPLKVGDSFIADVNDFAQAVLFAVDQGAAVVQEALGTLNHSSLGQAAIDYAYRHGVVVVASAADEEEGHHNWPSNYSHTLVVNSIRAAEIGNQPPSTGLPQPGRSYLVLNGCTNYGGHIFVSVPSSACSSEATGKSAGMVGLLESAARNEVALGHLRPYAPGMPLSAEEVRQIVRSTADDIDFEDPASPIAPDRCESHPVYPPGPPANYFSLEGPPGVAERFHTIAGFDQYTGYGRIDANCMVRAVLGGDAANRIPPEAAIDQPAWFANLDTVTHASFPIIGRVAAVRSSSYRYAVQLAFGVQPHGGDCDPALPAQQGDWRTVLTSGRLDHPVSGTLATLTAADIAAAMKAYDPATYGHVVDANGDQTDWLAPPYSQRPGFDEWDRYTITVRVCVVDNRGLVGEDRRTLQSHHDDAVGGVGTALPGFPIELGADGASSPVAADLLGDNRNELIFGTSDGQIHVLDASGHELPGWPQNVSPLAYHWGEPAFSDPEVAAAARRVHSAVLASVAVGDLDRTGRLEIVAADMSGYLYVFEADGRTRPGFPVHVDFDYSAPGTPPRFNRDFANRVQFGFLASPALADLDHDGRLWIVAGALDRHVYAWDGHGHLRHGFPVLLASPEKVASVDPTTHRITLVPDSGADNGTKIISSPAVGDLLGDGGAEIVIGRNEEYHAEKDGGFNAAADSFPLGALLDASGQVHTANSRVYAIFSDGWCHGLHPCPATPPVGVPTNAYVPHWPVKVSLLVASLLPYVGTGINTGPALARFSCPNAVGGDRPGLKVGVFSAIGPAYVFQSDGSSCYGQGLGSDGRMHDRTLDSTLPGLPPGTGSSSDIPYAVAVGQAAFANLGGSTVLMAPTGGLRSVLDLTIDDHQLFAQKSITAWDVATGKAHRGFPAYVNDAEFLNGPIAADLVGTGVDDVVSGSAMYDLRAVDANGNALSGYDKNTGDWMVATPLVAPLGPLDGHPALVAVTRAGTLFAWNTSAAACPAGSWPRFRHDAWNSGVLETVADRPEAITDLTAIHGDDGSVVLRFTAPHGHGACGNADHYEVRVVSCADGGGGNSWPAPLLVTRAGPAGTPQQVRVPGVPGAGDVLVLSAANRASRTGGNLGAGAVVPLHGGARECAERTAALVGSGAVAGLMALPSTSSAAGEAPLWATWGSVVALLARARRRRRRRDGLASVGAPPLG